MTREAGGSRPSPRVVESRADRLYAIGRADLPVGARAVQCGHALIEWTLAHGRACENLVMLQVPDRLVLENLARRLSGRIVLVHEPDMGGQLTAIAAGPECWRQVGSIPLLREHR